MPDDPWTLRSVMGPWTTVRPCLDGMNCLWVDLDGVHIDTPPADPPRTTHLWGWTSGDRLVRARADGNNFRAVLLGPADAGGAVLAELADPYEVKAWDPIDQRVSASLPGPPRWQVVHARPKDEAPAARPATSWITFYRPAP